MTRDAIIILGSGINPDGSLPAIAKRRVEKGFELYKKGLAKRIIMSGKCPFTIDYELKRTEAKAMKMYAVSLGIDTKDIFTEEKSGDTLGNAFFVRTLFLEPKKWKNITVVTSDYHMARTKYIFSKMLGPGYDIDFQETDSGLSKEELKKKESKENKILSFTKMFLEKIPDGDLKAIQEFMLSEHPAYAPNSKFSELIKDNFFKMIQRPQN